MGYICALLQKSSPRVSAALCLAPRSPSSIVLQLQMLDAFYSCIFICFKYFEKKARRAIPYSIKTMLRYGKTQCAIAPSPDCGGVLFSFRCYSGAEAEFVCAFFLRYSLPTVLLCRLRRGLSAFALSSPHSAAPRGEKPLYSRPLCPLFSCVPLAGTSSCAG